MLTKYQLRVLRVKDIIIKHSELSSNASEELAVHVLHALDTIPEQVR